MPAQLLHTVPTAQPVSLILVDEGLLSIDLVPAVERPQQDYLAFQDLHPHEFVWSEEQEGLDCGICLKNYM